MKTLYRVGALLFLLAAVSARAGVEFKPMVGASSLSGKTSYDINFGGVDHATDPTGGYINAESKLEFDLKALLTRFGLEADVDGGLFKFKAGYSLSVSEGTGKLRDRDWLYDDYVNNTLGFDALGGDTLSDEKSPIHILDIGAAGRLLKGDGVRLYGLVDYEYQKLGTFYVNNIDGAYTGWMTDGAYDAVHETFATPILSYDVHYSYFTAGLRGEFDLPAGFSIEGTAKAGYLSYSDQDDHILREKIATGSGEGYGGDVTGALSWKSKFGLGVSAYGRFKSFTANGKQTQVYYGGPDLGSTFEVSQTVGASETDFGLEFSYKFGPKHIEKKHSNTDNQAANNTYPATVEVAQASTVPAATGMVSVSTSPVPTPGMPVWPIVIPTATPSVP